MRQAQVPGELGRGGEAAVAALDALRWAGEHRLRESIFADVRQILGLELRQEEVVQGPVSGTTLVGRRGDDGTFGPASQLGTGLQHALPVLVQLGLLGRGAAAPTFAFIEEPEAHLHTRAQAELGDALIAPVRQRRGRLLIETHSEALLLRLLRRVAEGALPTTDLQLWFIDEEGAEVTPREVHVDDRGEPHGWPEGWFDTAYFEAQARRRAVRGRE